MSELYKRKPNTLCLICKKEIYKRPSAIRDSKEGLFCSQMCYGVSCRKEKPCVVCGKLIMAGLHKKTCSRVCANTNREGIKYGIRRPNDKVRTQQILKIRLLKERGKLCERCGYKKFEILQIHHKNRNRKDNRFINLELICPNCHFEEHYLEKSWLRKIN